MKTNEHARKVLKVRRYAGLVAVLLLFSAELCMVCSFGHGYGQVTNQPAVPLPAIGDWFAAK
jgi:hypothetical protein